MKLFFSTKMLMFCACVISLFLMGASSRTVLPPSAEALAKAISFDRKVLIIMKEVSGSNIHRMNGYNENDFQILVDGAYIPVREAKTSNVLASLRKKLKRLPYMAFVIEMNKNMRINKIGVLKTTDQYDILRIMHTDGKEYGITNSDVIERLQEWEQDNSFKILGAGNDWVEIQFITLPQNLKEFAEEVYDFCPDAIDQGPGTVPSLMRQMEETKKLFLWWD